MRVILDDDAAYLRWVAAHPGGWVVNCHRRPSANYLVLHRATCGTITGVPARGRTWTEGDYAKVCSEDAAELSRWASGTVGGQLHPCPLCNP